MHAPSTPSVLLTSLLCALGTATVTGFLDLSRGAGFEQGLSWGGGDGENELETVGPAELDAQLDAQLDAADLPASLAGQVLVAAPSLDDPYFAGTMIYLLADDEGGSLGVVLNHGGRELGPGLRLWDGGPVGRNRVFVLHDNLADPGSVVVNGIAVAADPSLVNDVLDGRGPMNARIFIGYAGWGPGQLEAELAAGAWIVAEPAPGMVLAH